MKKRFLYLIFSVFLTAVFCSGVCEGTGANRIYSAEGWSWDPGSYNTFEGSIDLSEYLGQEITIIMTTNLTYSDEAEEDSRPVFTVVNGKRITMLNQDNTIRCSPDSEHPSAEFSGRLKLPEKQHLRQISFQFTLTGENGQEIKTVSCVISDENIQSGVSGGAFYIPVNIGTVTLIIGIAAVLVWAAVLLRNRKIRNQKGTEN